MDFDSSRALGGGFTVREIGDEFLGHIIDVASGTRTRMETLRHEDPVELYFEGPSL
jgi:altronate dehydratase